MVEWGYYESYALYKMVFFHSNHSENVKSFIWFLPGIRDEGQINVSHCVTMSFHSRHFRNDGKEVHLGFIKMELKFH